MTWLAGGKKHGLRERGQIRKPVQTANIAGGFDRSYTTLLTVWCNAQPVKFGQFGGQRTLAKGQQTRQAVTHVLKIRRSAVDTLGRGFSSGFSTGFDSIADLSPLKSDCFIFVERGSSVKGTLYKIHRVEDVGDYREYLKLLCEEVEEKGTGH